MKKSLRLLSQILYIVGLILLGFTFIASCTQDKNQIVTLVTHHISLFYTISIVPTIIGGIITYKFSCAPTANQ